MSGQIILEREAGVATLTIDNQAKRNALSQAMWIALAEHLEALSREDDMRCIVLRGAGNEAFGSGADIEEFEALRSTKEKAIAFAKHGHRAMHAVRDCPIPTVAAIRGICVGGGLELAAGCDIRLASEDARFAVPIARLGAVLAYPELQALLQLVSPQTAKELLLEGRSFAAQEAAAKGLVSRVVAAADFDAELDKTVRRIAAGAPLSARWHKKFIARLQDARALSAAELDEGYACYDTQDFTEGWNSFQAKRAPQFQGK